MPLYYAIGLLILFVILLVGEFFIPTAGMMGVAAAITAVTAIVIGFTHSIYAGAGITVFVMTVTPVILITVVRVWPNTIIGRLILNRRPGEEHEHKVRTTRSGQPLKELEGTLGVAKSDLLPAGQILIAGHKMDAVSTGTPIDAGTPVIVVNTTSGKIRVRKALDVEILANTPPPPSTPPLSINETDGPPETRAPDPPSKDQSSTPGASLLDSLDLDSLD